ncbi:DUF2807 domain-containing protein [Acidiphilium sp. PA]|uniref:head GIN domain-containing protein n=1 Tax=Acidiphilium sp. PA TaxID=2871705 RepID=UPI002244103C|nr:head GIN domain-containing protein [Acidiphilium sp. PA]MCW8306946.1 DUF2807 domain-containing protein [Acidiphilium sp. PA]
MTGLIRTAMAMVAVLIATASAPAADITATRTVAAFTSLRVDGHFILHVSQGTAQSVQLAGDRYLIDNLRIGVVKGVLRIDRPHGFDLPKHQTVTITITTPGLTALGLRGLVHASVTGLTGTAFTLTNNGAAAATLTGTVGRFTLISRGVSSIDAGGLHARTVTMLVRGQGNLRVFASEVANVTMYGEGRIDVLGHPKVHQFKTLAYGIVSLK